MLGTRNWEELNENELHIIKMNWFYICAGLGIYLFLHRNWVNTFTNISANIIDAVSLFQSIFDNSEESTIIITDGKAEYINETFLNQFKYLFKQFEAEIFSD